MTVKQGKTMARLVEILREQGIEVVDHYDSRDRADTVHSSVVFYGDEEVGQRAVEIAWEHGYEPEGLVRDWVVVGKEFGEAHWLLLL